MNRERLRHLLGASNVAPVPATGSCAAGTLSELAPEPHNREGLEEGHKAVDNARGQVNQADRPDAPRRSCPPGRVSCLMIFVDEFSKPAADLPDSVAVTLLSR